MKGPTQSRFPPNRGAVPKLNWVGGPAVTEKAVDVVLVNPVELAMSV
jgi:hypothetical protein